MDANVPRAIGLQDLAALTLRANVAFAVRCAERIRPCLDFPDGEPCRRDQLAAVDAAIRIAAAYCNEAPAEPGRAAAAVEAAVLVAEETCEATRFAAYAAVRAAEAAAYAEGAGTDAGVSAVVAAAFGAGRVLAANVDAFTLDLVVAALYADVEKLLSMGHGSSESLGATIDPSEEGPLGSLWPAGVPGCFIAPKANE